MRKICLLREQGQPEEAVALEKTDFANAVRDFRLAHGPESLPESELRSLFAAEEQRVADAVVLSELLIPQLVKSFAATAVSSVVRSNAVPVSVVERAPVVARVVASAPQIADLLDGMLASERGARRQRTGS